MNKRQLRDTLFRQRTIQNVVFCILAAMLLAILGGRMGWSNMLTTMTATGYSLMANVVLSLLAVVVISGAWAALMQEFGIVYALEKTLGRVVGWVYGLPGKSLLGALLSFLSDTPVVAGLAADPEFVSPFRRYQLAGFIHFATSFGMGLVLVVFMMGIDYPKEYGMSLSQCACIGLLASFFASALTTRLQNWWLQRVDPSLANFVRPSKMPDKPSQDGGRIDAKKTESHIRKIKQSFFSRVLDSIIDGGKSGFALGLAIAPGIMVVSTIVFMVTFGAGADGYDGGAYQGVPLLPWAAGKVDFVFAWLFGLEHAELLSFPITALASVGASIGQLPQYVAQGMLDPNAACVLTAMGVAWSGFLPVYSSIMDSAGLRSQAGICMVVHFISGLLSGIAAHWLYIAYVFLVQ